MKTPDCQQSFYFDLAQGSFNKQGEELCGDHTAVWMSEDSTLLILADGLGSGVKASILSTLSTRIALTMLKSGESLQETIETLLSTLPTCKVRGIAYCTLTIIRVDTTGYCSILEYENPPVFIVRNNQLIVPERKKIAVNGKNFLTSSLQLHPDDFITAVSDGAIHAGLGNTFNHGWEWDNVGKYLCHQKVDSSAQLTQNLLNTCLKLYGDEPGDDTTVATLLLKRKNVVNIVAGVPLESEYDREFVHDFVRSSGTKIVCGGTTAIIVARETNKSLSISSDYPDPTVPPLGNIAGIDLVTEGVVTLNKVNKLLDRYSEDLMSLDFSNEDAATQLCLVLLAQSTHIHFWLGTAKNAAHHHPDFYENYLSKYDAIQALIKKLEAIGKKVQIVAIK